MKVVIYQDQRKITIDNISSPGLAQLKGNIEGELLFSTNMEDLQVYNFQITSTRGIMEYQSQYDDELKKEIEEGIKWQQETVN